MNEMETLIKTYNKHSVADSYIIGFVYKSKLYALKVPHIDNDVLRLEKASRNQGNNLKFRVNKENKLKYIDMGAVVIGTKDDLSDAKWNRGEMFEKIVTEKLGQTWVKDTVPFWKDGDITVNGEKIQIKLDSATLMNSKQMKNFN